MKSSSCLVVFLLLFPLSALGAGAAGDDINLAVAEGPGIADVTLTWTAGHGGPYTVFLSTLPPPEALPGNAIGTTAGPSWTEDTPIAPGVVLFLRVLGAGCVTGGECPSGFCADGFCCNTSCIGVCAACDLAGSQGTCTTIPAGQDPDDECVSGQACDGTGACAPCPAEICNGQDDDCDGQIDEGNPGGGGVCFTGQLGVCALGTMQCQSGSIICQQNVSPSDEVCNGQDDDCDGQVDEANPGGGAACVTGQLGVCAAGTTQCQGGSIFCQRNVEPSGELCDGLDNDCDGQVDEGNPGGGAACATGLPGVCASGTKACVSGAIACVQNVPPSADLPDENFLDTNCDGIDGDLTKAVFVSPTGSDVNPGTTPGLPVRTITQGVTIASPAGRNQVLVFAANYATESQIVVKDGVGIYGNYTSPTYATRTSTLTATVFQAISPTAVSAVNIVSPSDIQFLFILGANASALGQSAYGILATNSSGLRVRFSRVQAGNGVGGAPGGGSANASSGGGGGLGVPGCENGTFVCDTCSRPGGGVGGGSGCGGNGGSGGAAAFSGAAGTPLGGAGGPATPVGQGNWNTPSTFWGQNGAAGSTGVNGAAGLPGYAAGGYTPQNGGVGGAGGPGRGGGGGGGGGDGALDCDSFGGGGGGGGGGGCGSGGASGGTSAGGSFAVYLWASNALIQNCDIRTANGGAGGSGGTSGVPGVGGLGGRNAVLTGAGNNYGGAGEQDDGSNGGRGGDGGNGGRGGHGGGAAGGPSIGIVQAGGSVATIGSPVFVIGPGGAGGTSSGLSGPAGLSTSVHTP